MEVAVDALGRPESAEQLTDSYPRVQISRLRQNLSLYYSRCAPGEGQAAYVKRGDYHLRLAPIEKAYPSPRSRASAAPEADPVAPPIELPPQPLKGARGKWWKRRWIIWLGAVLVIVWVGLAAYSYWNGRRGLTSPAVTVVTRGEDATDATIKAVRARAEEVIGLSLTVSPTGRPRYVLQLQPVTGGPGSSKGVELSLQDAHQMRLYREILPPDSDPARFEARLTGTLGNLFGPTGVIARNELQDVSDPPKSDYECVLTIESARARGGNALERVRECLRDFPESPYRGDWLARASFFTYREGVLNGGNVTRFGPGWDQLQQALELDHYNPYANYVAGKVMIALGNCPAAAPYFDQTIQRADFDMALLAIIAAEAGLCTSSEDIWRDATRRVSEIIAASPNPPPLQRLNLIFAATALERADLVRGLLPDMPVNDSDGTLSQPLNALREGLASPAAFERNRTRLERVVDSYFWSQDSRDKLLARLEAVAAS